MEPCRTEEKTNRFSDVVLHKVMNSKVKIGWEIIYIYYSTNYHCSSQHVLHDQRTEIALKFENGKNQDLI